MDKVIVFHTEENGEIFVFDTWYFAEKNTKNDDIEKLLEKEGWHPVFYSFLLIPDDYSYSGILK